MGEIETGVIIGIVLTYLLGLSISIVWPYANAWLATDNPEFKFDVKKIAGRLVAGAAGIVPLLVSGAFAGQMQEISGLINQYGWAGYLIALLYGLGVSQTGREVQKTPGAVQAYRAKNGD